jgi:hypothetical protein
VGHVGKGRRKWNATHERMMQGLWDDGILSYNTRNVRYIRSVIAGEIGKKEIGKEDLSFYRIDSQKECLQTPWGG